MEQDEYDDGVDDEGEDKIGGRVAYANEEDKNEGLDINREGDGPADLGEDKGGHDPPTNDAREDKYSNKLACPIESTSRRQ